MAAKKVTFILPLDLVRRIKRLPVGKRSGFVKQAIEKELDRQDTVGMLRRMQRKAIWKAKYHPHLLKPKDFARYRFARDDTEG